MLKSRMLLTCTGLVLIFNACINTGFDIVGLIAFLTVGVQVVIDV